MRPVTTDDDDIEIKPLLKWFTGLTAMLVGSLAVCALFVAGFTVVNRKFLDKPRPKLAPERRLPPEPTLQVNPPLVLEKLRQDEDRILNHYGWIDRPQGVVRIPIDRAITLQAADPGNQR